MNEQGWRKRRGPGVGTDFCFSGELRASSKLSKVVSVYRGYFVVEVLMIMLIVMARAIVGIGVGLGLKLILKCKAAGASE